MSSCFRSRCRERICCWAGTSGNLLVVAANILYLVVGSLDYLRRQDGCVGHGISGLEPVHHLRFRGSSGRDRARGRAVGQRRGAIMVTFGIMIITPILAQKTTIERLLSSEWSRNVVRVLYYVLPKTSDVSVIVRHLI